MKKVLQITNGIALVATIFINYLSNTGVMNNTTIGKISNAYTSFFTPAGYTFAIWGIIYLLLFTFAIYQGRSLFVKVKADDFVLKVGWWFIASCVFNSLWVLAWIYEYTGWSCVFIFLLLASLLKIVINNRMQLQDASPALVCLVQWPFVIYAGWVTVASIANVSTYLIKIGWSGFGWSQVVWTILLMSVAVILNQYMLWKRNMTAFATVGAWALIGIGNANKGLNATILSFAFASAALLLVCCAIHMYLHRDTLVFMKLIKRKSSVDS